MVGLPRRFRAQSGPAPQSEKTYDFSALYICVMPGSGEMTEEEREASYSPSSYIVRFMR